MTLLRMKTQKPKFYQPNFVILTKEDRRRLDEQRKQDEAEQKAWDMALRAAACLDRGDKVFLHYEFDPKAKYWPHSLEIVEPKGDLTEPNYWRYCSHMNDFIEERMNWKQGQALDRNAGIFGFQTVELATLIKLSWTPDMVEIPG